MTNQIYLSECKPGSFNPRLSVSYYILSNSIISDIGNDCKYEYLVSKLLARLSVMSPISAIAHINVKGNTIV